MDRTVGIVLGCPRSGTSFLMKALEVLPHTECISGRIFPPHIAHVVNQQVSEEVVAALGRSLEFSLNFHARTVQNQRLHSIEKWLRKSLNFNELIQAFQRKRKVDRIIFKEPFLAFAPQFTYEAIPGCRIIHIYRDGRDCADSLVRSFDALSDSKLMHLRSGEMPIGRRHNDFYIPWWVERGQEDQFLHATSYVRSIWMWKQMVGRCHKFFSRPEVIESGRVLEVKYEDFVTNPMKFGEMIISHLGTTMTRRFRNRLADAMNDSIGIHKKKRGQDEIAEAESVAKNELKIYAYL